MITAHLIGSDAVEYQGERYTSEGALCRHLIGDGATPSDRIMFQRKGAGVMTGSLTAFASCAYPGGEAKAQFWTPHPNVEHPPALLAWHAARAEARVAAQEARNAAQQRHASTGNGVVVEGCAA